ncbi:MAG: hypothetical protein K0R25_1201 [Rickettsiaceae bacterium]|jgi:hypothetical protein|nr:hypothetical protein [Rickettsiaceae bacterium]
MKPLEKINLVKNVITILKNQYSYDESAYLLNYYSVEPRYDYSGNNVDFKESLLYADKQKLQSIAEELGLSPNLSALIKKYPENWNNDNDLKLFISHSTKNLTSAINLRTILQPYKINCFVAHKDIYPTLDWQNEIEKALNTMDCFVSLNTKDFNKSIWCQQETGFALSRNVDIIPIKLEKDCIPEGFASKIQAVPALKLEEMAVRIIEIIKNSKKIGELYNQINPIESEDDIDIPF